MKSDNNMVYWAVCHVNKFVTVSLIAEFVFHCLLQHKLTSVNQCKRNILSLTLLLIDLENGKSTCVQSKFPIESVRCAHCASKLCSRIWPVNWPSIENIC